jgi:hypothetical protein
MSAVAWILLLAAALPIGRAWLANRRTSLLYSIYWLMLAWFGWLAALARAGHPGHGLGCYVALCLTGCAGMAVLGGRRPGAMAWNLVVLTLLVVNLLPMAEGAITGKSLELDGFREFCVAATIAVGIVNYLPTRLAPAAVLLLAAAGSQFANLLHAWQDPGAEIGGLLIAFVPWAASAALRSQPLAASQFDRLWLSFRNRFGFFWAQRIREQFNRSAANHGWPVVLRWQGLRLLPGTTLPDEPDQERMIATFHALTKRFGPEDGAQSQKA